VNLLFLLIRQIECVVHLANHTLNTLNRSWHRLLNQTISQYRKYRRCR
jgi:hypothetical protein